MYNIVLKVCCVDEEKTIYEITEFKSLEDAEIKLKELQTSNESMKEALNTAINEYNVDGWYEIEESEDNEFKNLLLEQVEKAFFNN